MEGKKLILPVLWSAWKVIATPCYFSVYEQRAYEVNTLKILKDE